MAWLFNVAHSGSKRRFISFIMCDINGPWIPAREQVENEMHQVFKAQNEDVCRVNVIMPNGTKLRLRFKNDGLIAIQQSMLVFANEDLAEPEQVIP